MIRFVIILVLGTFGCSADDDKFTDCHLGDGTVVGTWRTHYQETDGTCGPIPDETNIFDPNAAPQPGCTQSQAQVSADKCRVDLAWSCPTTDGNGTQSWVVVLTQTGPGTLKGTGTVQANHTSLGTCRSTYAMTLTKI